MRYFIDVYGCQMNAHDSEIISGILDSEGFSPVEDPSEAQVILLMSCAVREHAETRVLGRAAQLGGSWKGREGGGPLLALCGCVAQEHGESLLDRFRDLDLVVGPDCYRELPALIRDASRSSLVEFRKDDYEGVEASRKEFPRAFVTIMRGCDNYCSYCIVPFVRGRERSRRTRDILDEVGGLASRGYGEITLLGQNVNSYRDGERLFPDLLEKVSLAAGGSWVRFVTSHPKDLDPAAVSVMRRHDNICRQLHLPVQSGSDRVLSRMNRGYSSSEYLDKIAMLREAMPGIVLSTDVIAGFPGETEDDFAMTVDLLGTVRFDYAFLFRYSQRSGTKACGFPDQVPEEIRLERLGILQELQREITVARSRELLGRELEVLVTGPAKKPGQQAGRTGGNRMVVLEGSDHPPGTFVRVRITRADGWTHFGKTLETLLK
ncbi:MAG: tRNA (N6-isopentenyl adenosine(37)-C2)-methylthiotransferase MiaB [Candidatus Fermentibacteraceae bacterium]|nr:tRNA (N6-isopentenyl adenosine(37)-C2)-methylthiotransferase MiaB [Candidatus Fermentibacteraceae bacterium]